MWKSRFLKWIIMKEYKLMKEDIGNEVFLKVVCIYMKKYHLKYIIYFNIKLILILLKYKKIIFQIMILKKSIYF